MLVVKPTTLAGVRAPPPPPRAAAPPPPAESERPKYKARYAFEGQEGEISLQKDDVVELLQKDDNGWWLVEKDGEEGWAPYNYLELVPPKVAPAAVPSPPPRTRPIPPPNVTPAAAITTDASSKTGVCIPRSGFSERIGGALEEISGSYYNRVGFYGKYERIKESW